MNDTNTIKNTGLRGVTIASTKVSDVDGTAGKLIYRGYVVRDLAEQATFEEVIHLLLAEKLPGRIGLASLKSQLAESRSIPEDIVRSLSSRPRDSLPMDILQGAVPMLANHDPDIRTHARESSMKMAIRLIARLPTVLATWHRIRNGETPIEPSADMGHAENFLYLLEGKRPDPDMVRFFDTCLVLHAEHSFNASTFAAREIASTRAHMYAAVAGAVGSLSGELHGGANVRVMEMLKEIGSVDNVEDYIARELDAGRVIFGLGHAVYKTDDPRARILEPMAKTMCERIGEPHWYETSRMLETKGKAAFKERKNMDIFTNVDFYSASLYYAMGIPIDFFTPVFAISRVAGWTAHILEEQFGDAAPKPALYRPESEYIGEYCGPDECTFLAIDDREDA